jgi:V-type H+-transporting ATPase subunit H
MTARLISDRELQLIRRYDKRTLEAKAALLSEDGLSYIEAFMSVLRNVNKDETVEYALGILEEMVDNDGALARELLRANHADPYSVFLRLLQRPDVFTQNKAAKLLAVALEARPDKNAPVGAAAAEAAAAEASSSSGGGFSSSAEEVAHRDPLLLNFVEYLCGQLRRPLDASSTATATFALSRRLKETRIRALFIRSNGVPLLAPLLKAPAAATKAANQQLYEAALSVWQLSYAPAAVEQMAQAGIVPGLVEVVKTNQKEKVLRVACLALKNLLSTKDESFAADMVEAGLPKVVQQRALQAWGDDDLNAALEWLADHLKTSIAGLSSFDKYRKEILSGNLDWTPMHSEDNFWRQNADKFEEKDCQALRVLFKLLEQAREPRTLAVGCYDVGQFITFHPRGRQIVNDLRGKELVMRLMTHPDTEVQKQALIACQKILLTKDKLDLVLGAR